MCDALCTPGTVERKKIFGSSRFQGVKGKSNEI